MIFIVMKVTVKHTKSFFNEEQIGVIDKFIYFLQKECPLINDVVIDFTKDRPFDMTTGTRKSPHNIYVLGRDRLLADILRTLSHEWIHEYEHQRLGLSQKAKVPNIGGPAEDIASMMMGIIFKKFERYYPKEKKVIYNEN